MLRFKKTVTKQGIRRFVEIPKDYYDVIKAGDKVIITVNDKKCKK